MAARRQWVLLAYRIPREPSTPRITVWRKLRRLGALQLNDGLVALPRDARTQEQLEWLADEIEQAAGEATLWFAEPATRREQEALAARLSERAAAEYNAVIAAARDASANTPAARRRTLARLRRSLRAIRSRDYFPPPERDAAERAVEALAALVEVA